MKIAICLSGQPRWFRECYPYFKTNIIENFEEVDVFIHAWSPRRDSPKYESSIFGVDTGYALDNTLESLQSCYSPADIEVEEQILFEEATDYPYPVPTNWPAKNVFSMFYSMKKCIDLKSKKEKIQGYQYDWVFRSRFDYAINRKFTSETMLSLCKDTLYSPHVVREGNIHCHGDFNFGSSKVIDCIGKTFDNIMQYGKISVTLATESMTYKQAVENGYKIEEFDLKHPFPPSKYDACWHSLWGRR